MTLLKQEHASQNPVIVTIEIPSSDLDWLRTYFCDEVPEGTTERDNLSRLFGAFLGAFRRLSPGARVAVLRDSIPMPLGSLHEAGSIPGTARPAPIYEREYSRLYPRHDDPRLL